MGSGQGYAVLRFFSSSGEVRVPRCLWQQRVQREPSPSEQHESASYVCSDGISDDETVRTSSNFCKFDTWQAKAFIGISLRTASNGVAGGVKMVTHLTTSLPASFFIHLRVAQIAWNHLQIDTISLVPLTYVQGLHRMGANGCSKPTIPTHPIGVCIKARAMGLCAEVHCTKKYRTRS